MATATINAAKLRAQITKDIRDLEQREVDIKNELAAKREFLRSLGEKDFSMLIEVATLRGRPRGARNKTAEEREREAAAPRRKPGRPKGSKNKPKP